MEGERRAKGGATQESWTPLTEGPLGQPAPECPTHLPLSPLPQGENKFQTGWTICSGQGFGHQTHIPDHSALGSLTPKATCTTSFQGDTAWVGEFSLDKGYEGTVWGGGQEHQGREDKAELPPLWVLVSKSVGQEPEETWRPQLPGWPVCLPPSEKQPKPLAWQTSHKARLYPFPVSPLQPPQAFSPPAGRLCLFPEARPHQSLALLYRSWPGVCPRKPSALQSTIGSGKSEGRQAPRKVPGGCRWSKIE